ncbi:MAG: glycerate kinase [Muribaculaceae bacterium]|nr:glycerate kinase [Muribaculaceae bacterium]
MKIVVAIDKFKGSATLEMIADTVSAAIKGSSKCKVLTVRVADGGDGTLEAVAHARKVEWHECEVAAPVEGMPRMRAKYISLGDRALIETAKIVGLALVPEKSRNIMRSSTIAVGEAMRDAILKGFRYVIISLGGSCTCDGGVGALSALGFEFLDGDENTLEPVAENLIHIKRVQKPRKPSVLGQNGLKAAPVEVGLLSDVCNPLLGPRGAARIFAPQKGASAEEVEKLEAGLQNFSRLMPEGVAERPGAGAAGGIAAGMMAFMGAEIKSGAQWMLEITRFRELISDADLVITGEGRIDAQTGMGKIPGEILKVCRAAGVRCIGLCGAANFEEELPPFDAIIPVTPPHIPLDEAMKPEVTLSNISTAIKDLMINMGQSEN